MLLAVIGWAFYSWLLARPPPTCAASAAGLGLGRVPAGAGAVRPGWGQRRRRSNRPVRHTHPLDARACWRRCCTCRWAVGAGLPLLGAGRGRRRAGDGGLLQQPHAAVRRAAVGLLLGEAPQPYHGWRLPHRGRHRGVGAGAFGAPSERARVGAAVDQQVLAGDVAGLRAAQEGAGAPNSSAVPKRAPGWPCAAFVQNGVTLLAALAGRAPWPCAQAVGVEGPGQQVVDGDVAPARRLARHAGDEAGQTRCARRWTGPGRRSAPSPRRGDVDDAAEAALGHPSTVALISSIGVSMLASSGLDPGLAVPVAEVARRRAAGVVDQDVHLRAGRQRRGAALGVVMSPATVRTCTPGPARAARRPWPPAPPRRAR
jgi:hypothetical protein